MRTTRLVPRLPLLFAIAACGVVEDTRDGRVGAASARFESAEATLLDFEIDGQLTADTADVSTLRPLIQAQLMYAVGQLNGERSVGRYERLEVSAITATASPAGSFQVLYHAKLPVAWGGTTQPTAYSLILPAAVAAADQIRFTEKYGTNCVDPDGGDLNAGDEPDAGRMFLFYRPQLAGCALDSADVVTLAAKVMPSPDDTTGKYPEYDRIWEDRSLDVTAIFGIEVHDAPGDFGVRAFEDFTNSSELYLASLQADGVKRTTTRAVVDGRRRANLGAKLDDGRVIRIDAISIGLSIEDEGASFDSWYSASTPKADIVLYSGHARHGANVRALMARGTFVPKKYLIWGVNGCDTLAYVDRTLAERRALLNPDDPSGTKYMDTISNVLGAWFHTGDETTMRFIRDIVAAGGVQPAPKTYREIFSGIDRDQLIVVTGEEDNAFGAARAAPTHESVPRRRSPDGGSSPATERSVPAISEGDDSGSCSAGLCGTRHELPTLPAMALVLAIVVRRSLARSQVEVQPIRGQSKRPLAMPLS